MFTKFQRIAAVLASSAMATAVFFAVSGSPAQTHNVSSVSVPADLGWD